MDITAIPHIINLALLLLDMKAIMLEEARVIERPIQYSGATWLKIKSYAESIDRG